MGTRNTADTHIFLILQDWTQDEKLEISSRVTAALGMSLCLPSPLLVKWGTRAHKQHFCFKTWAALCSNAAEGRAKGAVEAQGHTDVQTKVLRGSTNCNIHSPNEHCYATRTVEELCCGEDISDPASRTLVPESFSPWWRWSWRQCRDPSGSLIACSA